MSWFFLSVLHAFGMAVANILRKALMKNDKNDPVASAILFQFLGTAIVAVFSFSNGFVLPPIQEYPINFIIQAVFWSLATMFLFKAYKQIDASEITIIVTLESIVTIIAAVFFLKEVFNFVNIIGTIIVLVSVAYISFSSGKMAFNKGVFYAILYSIFAGIAVVNDTFMLNHSEVLSYLVIGWLTPGILLMAYKPSAIKKLVSLLSPKILTGHFIFTFIYVLGGFAFFYALAFGGQASQVNTITQTSVVLTVVLATIFLRERDHLFKKFICAVLVTIGVVLLR
ncbi:MAG TPA: EamA family transporter [Candidatus Limnocylindrales bacterium]|nr:EamA family transporter [Candidatus Limnocylindrales bacterium]